MNEQKQAQRKILEDTISFYTSENRSVDRGSCKYNGPNGKQCAAARYMTKPELAMEGKGIVEAHNFGLLNEKAKLSDKPFMMQIQILHDNRNNWNETGLSEKGRKEVERITDEFNL